MFVSQSTSLWRPAQLRRALFVFVLRFRCIRHFVINVINNICISIYYNLFVICAVIYGSFCCIYVWLDPGTYMIARFMFFYKPGVTIGRCCYFIFAVRISSVKHIKLTHSPSLDSRPRPSTPTLNPVPRLSTSTLNPRPRPSTLNPVPRPRSTTHTHTPTNTHTQTLTHTHTLTNTLSFYVPLTYTHTLSLFQTHIFVQRIEFSYFS